MSGAVIRSRYVDVDDTGPLQTYASEREQYMEGECADYAAALKLLRPQLKFGVQLIDGQPYHLFVHDHLRAYDYDGEHQLPYLLDHPQARTKTGLEEDAYFGAIDFSVEEALEVIHRRVTDGEISLPPA